VYRDFCNEFQFRWTRMKSRGFVGYARRRLTFRREPVRLGHVRRESMGGYGSGRSGGRPTTENGLTLNLSKLMRDRSLRPGAASSGSLVWTNTTTGERVGSIGYEAHLGQESGRVRFSYTKTRCTSQPFRSSNWRPETGHPHSPSNADLGHMRRSGYPPECDGAAFGPLAQNLRPSLLQPCSLRQACLGTT
jgi:hypothetical protein